MVLQIPISPEAEARLKEKAAAAGLNLEMFVARELERFLRRQSLDEILAPLRAEFEGSGMTEEELVQALEDAKHEMRRQQRERKAS